MIPLLPFALGNLPFSFTFSLCCNATPLLWAQFKLFTSLKQASGCMKPGWPLTCAAQVLWSKKNLYFSICETPDIQEVKLINERVTRLLSMYTDKTWNVRQRTTYSIELSKIEIFIYENLSELSWFWMSFVPMYTSLTKQIQFVCNPN